MPGIRGLPGAVAASRHMSVASGRSPPPRSRRVRGYCCGVALIVALVASGPPFASRALVPVDFNQFGIERARVRHGHSRIGAAVDWYLAAYSSGLNALFGDGVTVSPDIGNPREVFEYVFSWLPSSAFAYPTEGFYYYYTQLGPESVWGNIRLADLDAGTIAFTVFAAPGRESQQTITLGAADGIVIAKSSDLDYRITFNGRTVRFRLTDPDVRPAELELLPAEEFVGLVYDESGVCFALLFNSATEAFYFVLNPDCGVAESLTPLSDCLLIGDRTGFVYFDDMTPRRKVLVGVSLDNIKRNNFFDGPGDQVPYRARLRDRLHRAYPNTYLFDGIDEHGVWIGTKRWSRVAITPFVRYQAVGDVVARARAAVAEVACQDRGTLYTALTREWWNNPQWRSLILERLRSEGKLPAAAAGPR